MKYIYYTLSVLLLVLSFTACKETDEYKSPEESLAEENALLERYYNEPMGNGMTRLEYDTYNALDTIDHRSTTGMMLYLLPNDGYKELGDSVRVNKRVGYRYNIYKISVNNDTGVTEEFQYASNYNTSVPVEFTTAPVALFSKFHMSIYFKNIKDIAYSKNNIFHYSYNFV